jgi:hypothetical protein
MAAIWLFMDKIVGQQNRNIVNKYMYRNVASHINKDANIQMYSKETSSGNK